MLDEYTRQTLLCQYKFLIILTLKSRQWIKFLPSLHSEYTRQMVNRYKFLVILTLIKKSLCECPRGLVYALIANGH